MKWAGITAPLFLILSVPGIVFAEGISGHAEYNYSLLDSNSTDATGTTRTKSASFNQRYRLTMDKNIFPTLRLSAGGSFEATSSDNDTNGLTTTGSSTRANPNVDLTYSNGMFNGGAGFSRRMETSNSNGISPPTLFFDSYNGRFGWRPEDLPTLDLLYSTFDNYDERRISQDSTTSSATLNSRYKPLENMDMNYSANFSTLNGRLTGFESQSLNQSLRVSYSDMFLRDRLTLSSSYNIATQDTKTRSKTGSADELVSKSSDYYVRTDNTIFPITSAHTIIDNFTPTLIPINNVMPSNILLTFNSLTSTSTPSYSDHAGMQFFDLNPSVNKFRVVVKPLYTPTSGLTSLPDALVALFNGSWKVFSSDNGTDWKQVTGVVAFTRVPLFNSPDGTEAVEASFPTITARFIKLAVSPVDLRALSTQVTSVAFTRLEAFVTKSIPSNGKTSSQIAGLYDINIKARLLDIPAI